MDSAKLFFVIGIIRIMVKFVKKKYFFAVYILVVFFLSLWIILFLQKMNERPNFVPVVKRQWDIRSIDTMKYSRDLARAKLRDNLYDVIIDQQVAGIAATGANYVAIGTPYDEEFYPLLSRWVQAARRYKLGVWFRGNFSGWEEWFGYSKIDVPTHIVKTKQFILDNRDLFRDGDIFTSCPECENGMKLKWENGQALDEHRAFLIVEYRVAKEAFSQIGKKVNTGYYSMNGDLALALMDKRTTQALGGVVVVDHYVDTPEKLAQDIRNLASLSGGKIVLGEIGVPIPDIHGRMSEEEQDKWIRRAFTEIATISELIGVNYWVNKGGSTALWNENGTRRAAVWAITDFYSRNMNGYKK